MVRGTGTDLVHCFSAAYAGTQPAAVLQMVEETWEWLETGAIGARSANALAGLDRGKRELLSRATTADGSAVEKAMLRAMREMSDDPLRIRAGIYDTPKQSADDEYVWRSNTIERQRGATRTRKGRLLHVCSKVLNDPILPGPSAIIPPRCYPDAALLSVLKSIRAADPDARVLDVNLDKFVEDFEMSATGHRPAFPYVLQIPRILHERGAGHGPLALILPPLPEVLSIAVDGPARDISGLRIGKRGNWLPGTHLLPVKEVAASGELQDRMTNVMVTDRIAIRAGRHQFSAHIARVIDAVTSGRTPPPAALVAVMGLHDPVEIAEIAAMALSATDGHPEVHAFLQARRDARVFAGEQHTAQALHTDSAIASVALAAYLLDRTKSAARPLTAPRTNV